MADKNPFPGENNTGHVWDDNLRELNNPAPRWWMIGFYASIAAWIIYGILYPMWPGIGEKGFTQGILGWTMMTEYKEGLAEVEKIRAPFEQRIQGKTAQEILATPDLTEYAKRSAKVVFGDYCAPCHGNGGQGGPGYPVLADDDWLYGGTVDTIALTLTMGRKGVMNAHGKILSPDEIDALAAYVVGLSQGQDDEKGKALFLQKGCIACHGMDAKGLQPLGSANLTDAIWRFDEADRLASARYTIMHGVNDVSDPKTRQAEMPKFGERLSKDEIKKLAVFVHQLGGGQ